jgi:hypothetical protein
MVSHKSGDFMRLGICMAVLALSLEIAASSCHISSPSSEIKSLTSEELKACKFSGQRFLVVIAPEADFHGDFKLLQETFAKQTAESHVDKSLLSRFVGDDFNKQLACAAYRARDLSKNDIFAVLTGPAATSTNVTQTLQRLGDFIKNIHKQSNHRDAGVQVVIAVSSKDQKKMELGTRYGRDDIVFNRKFADLLYQKLMTKCEPGDNDCREPADRLADEVAVLIDDPLRSSFNEQIRTLLGEHSGYQRTVVASESSRATRFFGFTTVARESLAATDVVHTVRRDLVDAWATYTKSCPKKSTGSCDN